MNEKGIDVLNYEITDKENQEKTITLDEPKFFDGKKVSDLLNEIKASKQNDVSITDDDYVKKSLEKFNTMDSQDVAKEIFKIDYANAYLDDLLKSINEIEKKNEKSIDQKESPTRFQDLLNRNPNTNPNPNQGSSIGIN